MPLSRDIVGRMLPSVTAPIERGRVAFFARTIGESDPIYSDVEAATAAGHPDLVVPPTFLFGLRMEGADPFTWLTDLGIDLRTILHGTQAFSYDRIVHAGETVTLTPTITDVYDKKGGALEFLETSTVVTDAAGATVATMRETLVIRNTEREAAA